MKYTAQSNSSSLNPGEIQFYDAIEPPLKAGSYTIKATQTVENVNNPEVPTYSSNKEILIQGPEFTLNPAVIHSIYPPPKTTGQYSADLPNVVLKDFALPWSRPIDPYDANAYPNTPWMGLMTLYPEDMDKIQGPKSVTVNELINIPAGSEVLGPKLDTEDIGVALDTKLTVVDMEISCFQAISPKLNELEFLAHGREVNTAGKVMLGMDADGFFSLVIGNRFPKGGTETTPAENVVLLVSYEGYSTYLRGGSGDTSGKKYIRLVLLSSWKFNASATVSSFLSQMANLCNEGNGGVRLMQMPGNLKDVSNATAKEALELGYTALQNDMRAGEKATSWYRGPLVAAPTRRNFEYGTYLYSDHAVHYDPTTGIFDHSYSAAWQIGRLLALSDANFSKAFFMWRNAYLNLVDRLAADEELLQQFLKIAPVEPEDAHLNNSLPKSVQLLFARSAKQVAWPKYQSRQEKMLGDFLPGVSNPKTLKSLLDSDEDPLLAILKHKS